MPWCWRPSWPASPPKAGVTGKSVDAAARRVIEDAGYGEYFGHSFGHSVGLEPRGPQRRVHLRGTLFPGRRRLRRTGNLPARKFGVRIEDVTILPPTAV